VPDLNLIHRARLPAGAARPPAVVLVHGWLGNETVMGVFEHALPRAAALFYPRGPHAAAGGFGWYAETQEPETVARGLAALREFVTRLPDAYAVDPARLVLVGFSQGAAICSALTLAAPERVSALAMLAGFLPEFALPDVEPGRLQGKRVFIAHGARDETVPIEAARAARAALTRAGAEVTYHESHAGHKVSTHGLRELKQWLAQVLA
jgi:phospholipase/carboxylesterase